MDSFECSVHYFVQFTFATTSQGVEGSVIPFPANLSHLEGQGKLLVAWDIKGTHASLGQLLLLGRAAHCISVLERWSSLAARGQAGTLVGEVDVAVRDLAAALDLLAALCSPSLDGGSVKQAVVVDDLASLTVRLLNTQLMNTTCMVACVAFTSCIPLIA